MQEMDDGAKRWLFKTAHKHFWRIAHWYELDDLIQDGYWHFQRVVTKYPQATDRAHIMRLFQITFTNHITDLAKKRTRQPAELSVSDLLLSDQDPSDFWDHLPLTIPEESTFYTLVSQAPAPVRAVLSLFMSEDGVRKLRAGYRIRSDGSRETMNERICRLAGLDAGSTDIGTMLREYFSVS